MVKSVNGTPVKVELMSDHKRPTRPRARVVRRTNRLAGVLTGFAVLTLSGPAAGDSIRCGTRIISDGDHVARLLRYCGEPDFAHTRRALRPFVSLTGATYYPGFPEEVWIEEWTYNFGPHKFMRLVTLENGVVTGVKNLGYGYTQPSD